MMAGLKPLANLKVWGSVAIVGLVAFVLWQYSRHPEWLGNDTATSPIEGEFEGEVGNNVDFGVTVQDLQENRFNSQGFPPQPSQVPPSSLEQPILENSGNPSVLPPSSDQQNPNLDQSNPSIEFQPLMPNVKDVGSLFPPLTPSKDSAKPIKLPDSALDASKTPQESPLKDAIEDVFSQESSSIDPSPQGNKQPLSPRTRPARPNYSTSGTPSRSDSFSNPSFNNPYTYSSPQPYTQPYGNGRSSAPVQVNPSSAQFPNAYGNGNSNVNTPNQTNQAQPQPNYGIQPPQINDYGY
ncbi:hypothetical protein CY0110_18142 [Crocosphaera chwakensis CCY0110]|uniref:Uncharacterized protein n=1 Tax=Crocosphaera chwakensis CCY0110 TaxID=391612 RepID=A3IIW0_9CHRO|nr:hypothetical protein CY0110_18142 [Crocosphaera chwakensis CCY0110]